nr:CD209 antigen-like protein E [Nothobranchius furzeri]
MIRLQNSEQGEAAASQHEKPNRKSNLLLWALLAAALIIIYRLAFDKIRTNKALQTLKEEKGALQEDIKVLQEDIKVLTFDKIRTNKALQTLKEEKGALQEDNKVLTFDEIRTNKTLQTLNEEKGALQEDIKVLQEDNKVLSEETEALRKHISDHVCLKLDRNWEKHGDKCYYFNDRYLPWEGSRSFCEALGADLVKIDSREEQEFLVEKVKNFVMDDWEGFWIGLTDSEVEGIWTWVDGSPLDSRMKFWLEGQPDNAKARSPSGEDCVTILKGGAEDLNTWNDDICRLAHKSICEKAAGTGPSSSVCG